jgi:flavin reductase (DIM6/NTAB) family NADH-FMN oxidoreductase RutF
MKMSISPQPFVPSMPVIIVAVKDGEKINFAPHGMFGQLSYEPPLMYISVMKEHMTAKIINKTKKFSINIANTELLDKIMYCGSISGAEKDKSREFDVFYGKNDTPMISKCPVNMSCEVNQTIDTKDMFVFIGRITEMFGDEECLSNNEIIAAKVDPLICTIQGEYYRMGNKID